MLSKLEMTDRLLLKSEQLNKYKYLHKKLDWWHNLVESEFTEPAYWDLRGMLWRLGLDLKQL